MDKPKIAQKKPFVLEIKAGTYSWCACGMSNNQPYCDGSHRGSGFKPQVVKVEESKKVAWCGCKNSGNKPWCDGTHSEL